MKREPDYPAMRRRMADRIARRGIRDHRVLEALRTVPRELFVDPDAQPLAYEDRPLPIAEGQTISQPFIVALMLEAAEIPPEARILEIGTGSGYAAALLGHMASEVHTVEHHETLSQAAAARLAALDLAHVTVHTGDGTAGWPESAPYDAIIVAAAAASVPPPLYDQLAVNGRLIIPVAAGGGGQILMKYVRQSDGTFTGRGLGDVRFVPLVGSS